MGAANTISVGTVGPVGLARWPPRRRWLAAMGRHAQAKTQRHPGIVDQEYVDQGGQGQAEDDHDHVPFYQIVIGDPEIANVNPLTDKSFYVLGNNLGTTGIALFDENKQLVGTVDIEVTLDTDQLASTIRASVPDANIKVGSANGRVVLSGEADDAVAAEKANKIATRFSGNEEVINSVNISSSQQVQLNVRFVEINRQAGQDLGAKIQRQFRLRHRRARRHARCRARCRRPGPARSSAGCCRTAYRSTSPSRRWRSAAWPGGWPSRT